MIDGGIRRYIADLQDIATVEGRVNPLRHFGLACPVDSMDNEGVTDGRHMGPTRVPHLIDPSQHLFAVSAQRVALLDQPKGLLCRNAGKNPKQQGWHN